MTSSKGTVIVSGILLWYPLAGVTYQFLHYLIALRRLGWDTYYVEDSGRWVYDAVQNDMSPDVTNNLATVVPILERHHFGDRWAFRGRYPDGPSHGMSASDLQALYRRADVFLNVTGAQELYEEHLQIPRRIYIESDPFAVQVEVAEGHQETIAALEAHHTLFSFGENLGAPDCQVPIARFRWLPTRQPVVLDLWARGASEPGQVYTTITTWENEGKDVTHRGETYTWRKDRQFMRFLDLPRQRAARLELAAGVGAPVREMLLAHGWRQRDSVGVSRDVDVYRGYIQGSRGEFTVARDQYVRPRTGWFSDRSACYLAAGRPVITQETGFSKFLPSGKGLFGFQDMDDILAALDTIEADYEGNCRAARDIAAEYFDAEKVLASLLARAGL